MNTTISRTLDESLFWKLDLFLYRSTFQKIVFCSEYWTMDTFQKLINLKHNIILSFSGILPLNLYYSAVHELNTGYHKKRLTRFMTCPHYIIN